MMPFVVISYIGETVYKGMELIWIDAVNSNWIGNLGNGEHNGWSDWSPKGKITET
jgi:hypothetical protein